ncbi:Serine/threonine-protein kinase PrkC [Aquisphaera giovannonii]|uniref:Serine/threonine-protein kinase PrkC n=1 Tax=Aquisphaera giovannonii TaxID=406548 RepID=A0A5B9WCE6_9BACT|nr:serine/threonine-protein kinase [Aquisphaera giovannonii]QEH38286.1 Serine/threonine-protein kinase PrkC [Aquisphaera giovannonii]
MKPTEPVEGGAEPTVDFAPAGRPRPAPAGPSTQASASAFGGSLPRVDVVAGSGIHLSEETRSLLRVRLRAVSLAMSFAFGAFFVRDLFLGGHYHDLFVAAFHAVVVAAFIASFLRLSGSRPIALRRLRTLELALFGMTIAFFLTVHYRLVQLRVAEGDRVMLIATVKNSILFIFAMIVLYGMFIPNTWRRAAAVVTCMAAATILSPVALRLFHPEVFRFAAPLLTFETLTDNVLMLLIGAGVTTYAAHIIYALRVEAFEARQLNQYRLTGELGAGGMGVVYLAEHRLLKRPCALKLIAPDRATDPKAMSRFEREVRTTARLSHPNTVEIYDYGRTEDGTFYYVMELLDGMNLADLVARHGPLPPGRVVFLLRQACGALAEAHAAGLVHRDLKPANIFAARRGNLHDFAKVLDFGLVLPPPEPGLAEISREGNIAGSPQYMAPEQIAGAVRPDARTDLYGLGAVAYFLLCGRAPFAGPTAMSVMIAAARDDVDPPSRYRPDLPPDLERVVLRCLAKSPADRFPDATTLDRHLAACPCAAEWDFERASEWWRAHRPGPETRDPHPSAGR